MQDNEISHFERRMGQKIREARQLRGVTQATLGDAIGISYQQIQKYEKGRNRIPAKSLYEIANVLKLPLSYFLLTESEPGVQRTLLNRQIRLARSIDELPSEAIRRYISGLVHAINDAWEARTDP